MATLTVNGTALPEPQKILNVQWGTMTAAQLYSMINLIKSSTPQFTLAVLDPGSGGGTYTGQFYAGDLSYEDVKIDFYNNITFNTIKCDLIEC